ncbi:MAG TPA: ATP-binding protein [Gammaproteobacteria bacterium]|nr:ATP-binding protein [Gammaproteobacteria bacterium]
MSLRLQLLAVALLTLVLPWTGFWYVQEMEAALRASLEQSLLARAATVATALVEQNTALCVPPDCDPLRAGATVYATELAREPELDGVPEDNWNVAPETGMAIGADHRVWAGTYGRFVYLYVTVADGDLVYQKQAGQPPYGDRFVIASEPGTPRWWLLATAAPGTFRAQETGPDRFEPSEVYDGRILGAWLETPSGYALEVRVPLNLVGGALGVGVIDVDRSGATHTVRLDATWDEATGTLGRFVRQVPELTTSLAQFGGAGGRFRVLDKDGWVLATTGRVAPRARADDGAGLPGDFLRWLLEREDPPYPPERPTGRVADATLRQALDGHEATAWYGSGPDREAIVAAAVPILGAGGVEGAVLLEQASDPILTVTNRALVRLMSLTLLVTLVVGIGLLGYATWLSLRVRRLAGAAQTALGPRGEIRSGMPGAAAGDELGALARSFAELLERLREHTEYLRTLASKLSHELRTPLAVVTTSLDNLEHEIAGAQTDEYLKRLRQGTERLDRILAAMSEATELEQAIRETPAQPFDLAAVVASCCAAYRDVYPEREIEYRSEAGLATIVGSDELIAQLLDKLVDNAVSFSAPGSRVDIVLGAAADELVLSVANRGPRLPEKMRGRLFDSLVSIREYRDGRPHLGLGLHIAALVADFHGGRCEADDLPDGSGVIFKVWFPRANGAR